MAVTLGWSPLVKRLPAKCHLPLVHWRVEKRDGAGLCGLQNKAVRMKVSGSRVGILAHGFQVDWGGDTLKPGSFVCCEVASLEYSFFHWLVLKIFLEGRLR